MSHENQSTLIKKEIRENHLSRINWDWLVFKSLTIFGAIIFIGLIAFFLWFILEFK